MAKAAPKDFGDDHARVLAQPVARAVPRVAERATCRMPSASRWRATPRPRAAPRRSRAPPRSRARWRRSTTASTILASNIEDEPNNTTRFLVLGDYEPQPSGRDKTSLVLSARNRAGAVYEMLTPFATRGVSMTKFESRPSRVALWEYLFFVDIEGHRDDAQRRRRARGGRAASPATSRCWARYPAAVLLMEGTRHADEHDRTSRRRTCARSRPTSPASRSPRPRASWASPRPTSSRWRRTRTRSAPRPRRVAAIRGALDDARTTTPTAAAST